LRQERDDAAGDEQGRHHARQRMVPRVPLEQLEGLDNRGLDLGIGQRKEIRNQERREDPELFVHGVIPPF
jgi:hypothetical protein